jgi:hypothetical protein
MHEHPPHAPARADRDAAPRTSQWATVFHPPGVVRLITPAEQAAAAQAAVRAAPGPNGAPRAPTPSTHQTSAAPTRAGAVEEIEMANFSVRFAYPVDAPHPPPPTTASAAVARPGAASPPACGGSPGTCSAPSTRRRSTSRGRRASTAGRRRARRRPPRPRRATNVARRTATAAGPSRSGARPEARAA